MKFKNISGKAIQDVTLILAGEIGEDPIEPNAIFEVKDQRMIERVMASALYEKVEEPVVKSNTQIKKRKSGGK